MSVLFLSEYLSKKREGSTQKVSLKQALLIGLAQGVAASVFFGVSPVWLVLAAIFAGIFSGRSKEKRGENRE